MAVTRPSRARNVVITGGASGIGLAMAEGFARLGDRVTIIDRDGDGARGVASELVGRGLTVASMAVDVSITDEISEACQQLMGECGAVDVLCNNAGIKDFGIDAVDLSLDGWDKTLAVNLTAPFLFTKLLLPGMLALGSGVIINTASVAAFRGGRSGVAYTASKHAVVGLTRNVAFAFAPAGIRCNAICPGSVTTNIHNSSRAAGAPVGRSNPRFDLASPLRPATRGSANDVASLALFLASEEARFINGASYVVDGGASAG